MADKEALGYIDFSKVFKSTKAFIDTHNEKHFDLKVKLNASHRATAELIIRMYVKQLNQAISLGDSFKKELPGFRTYNSSLASCKGCTVKTILNHKRRLRQAGFISYEQNRGKSGIELWVNMDVFGQRVKNLHPLVHVQQEQVNNNRGVDKLITSKKGVHLSVHKTDDNCVTGTEQEQDMNTEESRIFDSKKQIKDLKNESDSAFSLQLVRDFWRYARVILYTHKLYSEPEEAEILNHIWSSVFLKFKIEGSREDWKEYQDILYKRINMVSRWLERDSNRWIPPAHVYFHPENQKNSFRETYKWFVKQEVLKQEIRNQLLIQQTEQEWKDHDKGVGKHKSKTRFELFCLHHKRLSAYNDVALIKAYKESLQRNLIKLFT